MPFIAILFSIFFMAAPAVAVPALSVDTSAEELYAACTSEDAVQVNFCHGVVLGVSAPLFKMGLYFDPTGRQYSNFYIWKNAACGDQPEPEQLVAALGVWLENNQKIRFIRMVDAVHRSVRQTWPCRFAQY
jgi:hypothetical protein